MNSEFLIHTQLVPVLFFQSFYSRENNQFSVDEMLNIRSLFGRGDNSQRSEPYKVINSVAHIPISGILIPKQDFWLDWLEVENTVYSDIIEAVALADADPSVETVCFDVCSTPGGYVNGSDEAAEAIANASKPTVAVISGYCCSAGVKLVSQVGHINAATRGVKFGSIGTKTQVRDISLWEKSVGITTMEITNSDSPDKTPDPMTIEGKQVIIDGLNDSQEVFLSYLEEGYSRNSEFSLEKIIALKGRVVSAKKAMSLGLIDSIGGSLNIRSFSGESTGDEQSTNSGGEMSQQNLDEVLALHPVAQGQFESQIAGVKSDCEKQFNEKIVALQSENDEKLAQSTQNTLGILQVSGIRLTDDQKSAIETGVDAKQFAFDLQTKFNNGGSGQSGTPDLSTAKKLSEKALSDESDKEQEERAMTKFGKGGE